MPQDVSATPPEVVQRILREMSPKAQVAFISSCKHFYRVHSLDLQLARLQKLANKKTPVLLALAPQKTLVRRRVEYGTYPDGDTNDGLTSDTDDSDDAVMVPGSAKYKTRILEDWVLDPKEEPDHALANPFVLVAAAYTTAKDDILLHVAFPEHRENSEGVVEVIVEGPKVHLSHDFRETVRAMRELVESGANAVEPEPRPETFSYVEAMQTGCVFERITSSGAVRRWWMYDCRECGGTRTICPGCGGVSMRWPDVFSSCGFDMPCPMCVGYSAAEDAKYYFGEGDQRTVDETLNVAPVGVRRWSKEEWEADIALQTALPQSKTD